MKEGYLTVINQRLYYEVHGEGDPLVLIMGLGNDATAWSMQIPTFAQHFEVIAFDNRDVGRSATAKGSYTIADMADDTAALLTALGVDRAHVLGASMGGAIAQEMALRHPEKVRKLVLACTMGRSHYLSFLLNPLKLIRECDPDNKISPSLELFLCMTSRFFDNAMAVDELIELSRNPQFPQPVAAFGRQVEAVCSFDAMGRLGMVKVPTLVLVGDQDILTPPWQARQIASAIPGARLQILQNGGHGFMWEIAEQMNQAVLEFLRS